MFQSPIPVKCLSNGIKVVFLPIKSEAAHLGVTVLGGSRYEEKDEIGLAHFLEHCFFKGTSKRKTFHILSRIDSVGGELNAFTTKEEICVYSSFAKKYLERAVELLADIVIHSNFPEKEIFKEKEIILDEINSYLDSPSDRIYDEFESNIFKNHPLGENILGTRNSVLSFTKEALWNYMHRFFHTQNMAISVVGDFAEKKVMRLLEKYFAETPILEQKITPKVFSDYKPFHISKKASNFQAHAIIGSIAPGFSNENERRVMTLLVNVLGGPALNSRLLLSIREKYGYTYSIEASYNPFREIGYWDIYFGCEEKYVQKTLSLVQKELNKVRETPFTTMQLHRAKEQFKGQYVLSVESHVELMIGLGKSALHYDQIDSINMIYNAIDEISAMDISNVANKYMSPDVLSELVYYTS